MITRESQRDLSLYSTLANSDFPLFLDVNKRELNKRILYQKPSTTVQTRDRGEKMPKKSHFTQNAVINAKL